MKNISYCGALLIVVASTGACSESAARLSPTSPSVISPTAIGSSANGIRNSTAGSGTALGDPSTAAGGSSTGTGGDPGSATGPGSSVGGDPGSSTGPGSGVGGDPGSSTGPGSGVGGDPGSSTGPGSTVTISGVVAYVAGGCPGMEMRLQEAPYTIVTSAATTFVSNAASSAACAQVAQGAAVSVTGVVVSQTSPGHSPTLRAQRVKVK